MPDRPRPPARLARALVRGGGRRRRRPLVSDTPRCHLAHVSGGVGSLSVLAQNVALISGQPEALVQRQQADQLPDDYARSTKAAPRRSGVRPPDPNNNRFAQ